jgi:hypothetical protein
MTQGISLQLNEETLQAASLLAEATFKKYEQTRGYYKNTAAGHRIGRLGEFAVYAWLTEKKISSNPCFLDVTADRMADLITEKNRIEIKTWNQIYWKELGRCVAVGQYPSMLKKADVIVWATVNEPESASPVITLRGWNTVELMGTVEPKLTGSFQVNNYQIEEDQLNEMGSLE